jgi:hypothetical protein
MYELLIEPLPPRLISIERLGFQQFLINEAFESVSPNSPLRPRLHHSKDCKAHRYNYNVERLRQHDLHPFVS